MNFLHVGNFDCAGAAWHHRRALLELGHDAVVAMQEPTHVAMSADLHFGDWASEELQAKLKAADVIIAHVSASRRSSWPEVEEQDVHERPELAPYWDKTVLWANGSHAIRSNPAAHKKRYQGYKGVATNHDIAVMLGFVWIPACIDRTTDAGDRIVMSTAPRTLAHAFSDANVKNVSEARAACAAAGWDYIGIDGVGLHQCLETKAGCMGVFDHMQGYFGLTAMEASAMGQPCAVGLSDGALAAIAGFGAPPPPWVLTRTQDELVACLHTWAKDATLATGEGAMGRLWYELYFRNHLKAQRFLDWIG